MNLPPEPGSGHNPFEPPPVGSFAGLQGSFAPKPPASSEALAALVCGVLALSCFPLGFVAIWLGTRARRAARENPERVGGEQLALAGMIVGGIFSVLWLLFWLLYIVLIGFAVGLSALHK